jgi:hypothetical protein
MNKLFFKNIHQSYCFLMEKAKKSDFFNQKTYYIFLQGKKSQHII